MLVNYSPEWAEFKVSIMCDFTNYIVKKFFHSIIIINYNAAANNYIEEEELKKRK